MGAADGHEPVMGKSTGLRIAADFNSHGATEALPFMRCHFVPRFMPMTAAFFAAFRLRPRSPALGKLYVGFGEAARSLNIRFQQ